MSQFCAKCGAPWSPGLCGICATKELVRERDEARAEVERLRASVENLDALYVSRTDALRECEAALRTVAERQREACSDEVYSCKNAQWLAEVAKAVRATPLVTEGEP